MQINIQEIISQMTLEEKASLCSGASFWRTKGIERLGIPSIGMTDGPHGLRKQKEGADHLGLNESVPATCFPSASGLACSWDRNLIEKVGIALGEECQAEDVAILLGPGANIKRSPLCGRNFEYFSEDPYLSSELAASHINGVQSQGVGTSLKHFAANNQEHRRMSVDAVVDERTLREIYLASFEGAVKKAQPWTVMSAYNKVNGEYASENEYLLTNILKEEWGLEGFVVSDWGAVNERVSGLSAGLDLEMPPTGGLSDQKIVEAVKNGELSEEKLNQAVERMLSVIFKAVGHKKENAVYDKESHHQLARVVASECMVLLKNEDSILPLKKEGTIAVIGELAKTPRYQGGGSSHINPTKLDNIFEEIEKTSGSKAEVIYAQGYELQNDEINNQLMQEAREAAKQSTVTVLFVGLPDRYESEGYDREHLRIPRNQQRLIKAVAEEQENLVIVLSNGAPIEMPWVDRAKGILEGYLGGQASGGAIADLLFGEANPSGKLAETFPVRLKDNPSYLNFPGEGDRVEYKEGLFVGYRYYDTKEVQPLFPFGYGLSYTNFEYSNLSLSKKKMNYTETVTVTAKVKNTGMFPGKEIVQLYVRDVESTVVRPSKELKGFDKVSLQPGEEKTVTFVLDKRAFAYYNVSLKDWHVESGEFEILIGKSSQEIILKDKIHLDSNVQVRKSFTQNTPLGDMMADPTAGPIVMEFLSKLSESFPQPEGEQSEMVDAMAKYMPLRAFVSFSNGAFTYEMLNGLLFQLNKATDSENLPIQVNK
ncbi:glycosyl hydrolase [Bacillus sp. AFS076308]|uniref:glycoside hydrolase family 3 C-terminal domain-containing protein n=1 Tax=unclassified Bacillus (in: firmicutes) TaxID=185979 RepID=UPI000BF7E5AB|nr:MULTISPECIES: glycoside hydrolase family 3 C-terminal domain-containing protein [unclassified Bacillus (in: firmicutes)]PFO07769.1 glycosyl hydrolase [Bacillus sp. AFS076308]PGV51448.1 glycosyl hydrolase [Bacillus sp. AFS037270]